MKHEKKIAFMFAIFMSINFCAADTVTLLSYGDLKITKSEFLNYIDVVVPADKKNIVLKDNKRVRQIIADMYVTKMLVEEAKKEGLDKNKDIKTEIEIQENRILMAAALDHYVDKVPPPDFEALAKEAYLAKPEEFRVPEQVSVSHILVSTANRSKDEAENIAKKVLKELREDSAVFADIAQKYSDDRSVKQNDGHLGFFPREKMVPEFADAAFSLTKLGEISDIVETQFGLHIIKFHDRKQGRILAFDEVKNQLIAVENNKFRNSHRRNKIGDIQKLEGIVINQEAVNSISTL